MAINSYLKRLLKWGSIVIIALFLLIAVGTNFLLTPKNLKEIVENFSREYLNAEITADTIELKLFSNFPHITLSIKEGKVTSHALDLARERKSTKIPASADSLLSFRSFDLAVSLPHLLLSNINIKRVSIVSPHIYAFVTENGEANYNIFKNTSEDSDTSKNGSLPNISVSRISVRDGAHITYLSRADSIRAEINLNSLRMGGNLSTDIERLNLRRATISRFSVAIDRWASSHDTLHKALARFMLDSLNFRLKENNLSIEALSRTDLSMNDIILADNFPVKIGGNLLFDTSKALSGELEDFYITIANIPIKFEGDFDITPESIKTRSIKGEIDGLDIANLLKYIPDYYLKDKDKIRTNAKLFFNMEVKGEYNFKSGAVPLVNATLKIPKSYIELEGKEKSRINNLESDIKLCYNGLRRDSSIIEINKLIVDGRGLDLNLKGKISEISADNPFVNLNFGGAVNLDTLSTLFPATSGSVFAGSAETSLSVKSRVANLNLYNLGNADIKGEFKSDRMKVIMPEKELYTILSGISVKAGSSVNKLDSSIKKGMKMLATNATADSIYFRYKDEHIVAARELRIAGHHSTENIKQDSSKREVLPFNGTISAKSLFLKGADSASLRMSAPKIRVSVLPYNNDYSIPHLKLETNVNRLAARDIINRVSLGKGEITINAILDNREDAARRARMMRMLDSLQNLYPSIERDSLFSHHRKLMSARTGNRDRQRGDDFYAEDFSFKVDRSLGNIIRKWNISGEIKAQSSRITSPYFPLRTRLSNINFNFTTDRIEFDKTKVRAGKSQFILTGGASGLRNAMLRNTPITINGLINSDTLNFSELLLAFNRGMEFMDADSKLKDSLSRISDEEKLQQTITSSTSDTSGSQLIIVPGNINGKITLDVGYGTYSNLELERIAGELLIKERCLQINGFEALTSAGNMHLSAFYATKSKRELSTGFDLELKDMAIEKLIGLMPSIDTLLPMLKSFEGIVNCQIAATSKIDTAMNLQLPTLKGVARITGDNLVLMDGETFSIIAKKLKFKNKEKNYIDRISVEMLLNESKIEVFPFIAEMDRYKFAISGTQNLDLSFNYNISILSSPLPFRLGVKVYGNIDDFDFKIGKSQYKNDKLPVYSKVIDSTRVNLKEHIANIYRIGVDAAMENDSAIEMLQEKKLEHDKKYTEQLDSLSSNESSQYQSIVPNK